MKMKRTGLTEKLGVAEKEPALGQKQRRVFGLKSGGTNAEGERGALG